MDLRNAKAKKQAITAPSCSVIDTQVFSDNPRATHQLYLQDTIPSDEIDQDLLGNKHADTTCDHPRASVGSTIMKFPSKASAEGLHAMREHLDALLPAAFRQNEYGEIVHLNEVSYQHIAKLQAKLWHEVPRLRVDLGSWNAPQNDLTISIAKDVHRITTTLALANHVFILRARSSSFCDSTFCAFVQCSLHVPHSNWEVTLEPLIDWITIDPLAPETSMSEGFQLFVRNKALWNNYSLRTAWFVPPTTPKTCIDCLRFLVTNRANAQHIMMQIPGILQLDVPVPAHLQITRIPDIVKDKSMAEQQHSKSSDSRTTSAPSIDATQSAGGQALHYSPLFSWDGTAEDEYAAFGGRRKNRNSRAFEVWRDAISEEEASYPAPQEVMSSPHFTSVPTSRAVASLSVSPYSGYMPPSYHRSEVQDLSWTDHMQSRSLIRQEPSCQSAPHTCFEGPVAILNPPPPGTVMIPKVTYPISAESNFPVLAQGLLNNRDIEPSVANHIPWAEQLICSCRKPARTFEARIVQCKNSECAVGWYHYACLQRSAKISSRWGNFHCQACRENEEWRSRTDGEVVRMQDFKIPFAKEEMLAALMVGGERDPYGLAGEM